MPGFIRAQAVFQGATNLPEDRFINTFHFEWFGSTADYDEAKVIAGGSVESFYLLSNDNGRSLRQLMSPFIVGLTINVYDLSVPEGEREPWVQESVWTDSTVTANMPEECAVCLTLVGVPPITPRRRGRLFFGPLVSDSDVIVYGNDDTPTRVNISTSQSVGVTLSQAAETLRTTTDQTWCIRSVTPSENFVPIAGGWIDNAFDTQRRRGPDPSARLVWP